MSHRPISLCCLSHALVVVFAVMAHAQSDWQMIDEQALLDGEVSRELRSPAHSLTSQWGGKVTFLAMHRNDELDLLWGVERNRSTLKTDWNSGIEVELNHEPLQADSSNNQVRRIKFLAIGGEGETDILGQTYESSSSVFGGGLQFGRKSGLLRGESRTMIGLRYLNIADHVDLFDVGGILIEDLVEANNHVLTMDGILEGSWRWKRVWLSSSLSGGVGFNQSTQSGWSIVPSEDRYEQDNYTFCTAGEFKSVAAIEIAQGTNLSVGAHGLMVTGVAQVRDGYGEAGDLGTVRLVGFTLGIEREF